MVARSKRSKRSKRRKTAKRKSVGKRAVAASDAQPAITKKSALEYLRKIEAQLYSRKTESSVGKLSFAKKLEFFRERSAFSALILALNAQLMRDIGADLQAQAQSLKEGIDKMSISLTKLEGAAQWAKVLNTITTSIGKVVKLFA